MPCLVSVSITLRNKPCGEHVAQRWHGTPNKAINWRDAASAKARGAPARRPPRTRTTGAPGPPWRPPAPPPGRPAPPLKAPARAPPPARRTTGRCPSQAPARPSRSPRLVHSLEPGPGLRARRQRGPGGARGSGEGVGGPAGRGGAGARRVGGGIRRGCGAERGPGHGGPCPAGVGRTRSCPAWGDTLHSLLGLKLCNPFFLHLREQCQRGNTPSHQPG